MKIDRTFFGGMTFVATLGAALLAACGRAGIASAGGGVNVFEGLQGTYAVACARKALPSEAGAVTASDDGSVTVGDLVGADRANVSLRVREYESPSAATVVDRCSPARLTWDFIVFGQIRDLGKTKTYSGPVGSAANARVVEFTYHGFNLVQGSLRGMELPLLDTKTQVAYLLDGNTLYLDEGPRGADGLASRLGKRFGVRQ
jgi:hypothetical protein